MAFLNTLSSEKSSSILAAHILTLMEANHDDKINMMLYLKMKSLQLFNCQMKTLDGIFFAKQKSSFTNRVGKKVDFTNFLLEIDFT